MNLIYLMAVGAHDPRFYESVQWCVRSLRRWGAFAGEILVVTDDASPELLRGVGDDARVLEVDADRLCDPAHGRSEQDKYLMARLHIHHLVDLSPYDRVMYVDADVLAIRNVDPLFEGVREFRFSREFQPMSAPMYNAALTDDELVEARWRRGINSGVYVAPASYLPECLDTWKRVLDASPHGESYDQAALNAVVLRKLIRARPMPSFSVAYPVLVDFAEHMREQTALLHYCGNRRKKFARMERHYESLEEDRPLQVHFGIDEDLDVTPGDGTGAPRLEGAERGLVIAIDHDREGVESHALVNQHYARELHARGHQVITLEQARSNRPDVVLHHNFERDFNSIPLIDGVPHVAVRTSDFGPHPRAWVDRINAHYEQLWVHTEWIRQHALEGGVEPERIRLVPHGIDPRVFRPIGHPYALPTSKRFRFLFVGGTVQRKGIDILLKAYTSEFARDEDVCLVIKDHGANLFYRESPFRAQILELARDETMPEILHLDDHLPSLELAALYRACTVGVWPYRAEGFLNPALECLACGTPTMLPEIGPTADFSTSRTSFLLPTIRVRIPCRKTFRLRLGFEIQAESLNFCEVRPDVLARHLRQAFEAGAEDLKAKGAAGVAMAHGHFTWARAADRMETCIGELLHANVGGA